MAHKPKQRTPRQSSGASENRSTRRSSYLERRREQKFKHHKIKIVDTNYSELRDKKEIRFKHEILRDGKHVGFATTHRNALKRAHQVCRDVRV